MTALGTRALRDAFGSFMTGVTVITTIDGSGQPVGFTANSFSSVSLDPPLLLVCPGRFLTSFPVFEACSSFAVSVLAEGQENVSNIFASFRGDRFAEVAWRPDGHGVPLIDGAAAHFSCKTAKVIPAGDHIVLLGAIEDFAQSGLSGLGYAKGQYVNIGLERLAAAAPKPGRKAVVGAIIEHQGKILVEETKEGLHLPEWRLDERAQVRQTLKERLAKLGLDVILGGAYSIFEDRASGVQYTYFRAQAKNAETGDAGAFMPISKLSSAKIVSKGHAAMLVRYALEYEAQDFALYVGDEGDGDLHSFQQGI